MRNNMTVTRNRVTWARCASTRIAEHGTVVVSRGCQHVTSSTSLHPLAPPKLPGFLATMGALTPVRLALRTGRSALANPAHEHRPVCRTGLPSSRHRTFRPFCLHPPAAALEDRFWFRLRGLPRSPAWAGASTFRVPASVIRASPLARRLAATAGRIEFVILRTGRSPPVAPHLSSWRRSFHQIQSSEPNSGEDFHLSDSMRSKAH